MKWQRRTGSSARVMKIKKKKEERERGEEEDPERGGGEDARASENKRGQTESRCLRSLMTR